MRIKLVLAASLLAFAAQPVLAQQSITTNDRNWKHDASGVKLPRKAGGLSRGDITAFDDAQTNIGATYGSNASGDYYATVYLYPLVDGDRAVWFDRAYSLIALNEDKYEIEEAGAPRAFSPEGDGAQSGLMASFSLAGDGFGSTLVAIFPVGNGLTGKLRMSSTHDDRAALEAFAAAFLDDIKWRADDTHALAPVVDCADTLAYAENPAVLPIDEDTGTQTMILGQLLGSIVENKKKEDAAEGIEPQAPTPWCREPGTASLQSTIYRPTGRTNAYLFAQDDAGLSINVWRHLLESSEGTDRYMIELGQAPNIYRFPEMDGLPSPRRLIEHIKSTEAYWGAPAEDVKKARISIVQ